jgi:hypothetical protein
MCSKGLRGEKRDLFERLRNTRGEILDVIKDVRGRYRVGMVRKDVGGVSAICRREVVLMRCRTASTRRAGIRELFIENDVVAEAIFDGRSGGVNYSRTVHYFVSDEVR